MEKKTNVKLLHSNLKDKYKIRMKEDLKALMIKDENGFVRIDPRFLSNI